MNLRGAIFDMDGTLLDSMRIWKTVADDYLIAQGVTPKPGLRDKVKTMSLEKAAEYMREEYALTQSPQEIADGVNGMIADFYENTAQPKKGAPELLSALSERGVKIALATATDRHLAEAALKRAGILRYFSAVCTCGEVGFGKKRPDVFLAALEKLGTKMEETYVVEDALFAMETAKRAGFSIAAVYDESAKDCVSEIKELADIYAETPGELINLL